MRKSLMWIAAAAVLSLAGCSAAPAKAVEKAPESKKTEAESSDQTTGNEKTDFPKKPITIICPFGAGGGIDILSRIIAQGGQQYFGQPINVVNRDGAGGVIATTEFLKEKGDGYTVILEGSPVFVSQPKMNQVAYSQEDFKPVITTTEDAIILVTHKDAPFQTVEELKEYGKDHVVKFGFTGAGGLLDIAQRVMYSELGIQSTGISVSGAEATTSLLGGHVDITALHPINIMSHEEAGNFIPLAVFSEERIEQYPDVPTAKELGYDIEFEIWKFILAPKDTPDEVIDILYEGFRNIINDPDLKQRILDTGTVIVEDNSPETTGERLSQDIKNIGDKLDQLGMSKY